VERPIGKVPHGNAHHMTITSNNLKKMMIGLAVFLSMIVLTVTSLYTSIPHEGLGRAAYLWRLSGMGVVPALLTNGQVITSQATSNIDGNDARQGLELLQEEYTSIITHDLDAPLQVQDSVPPKLLCCVTIEAEMTQVIDGFASTPSVNQRYHDQHDREWFILIDPRTLASVPIENVAPMGQQEHRDVALRNHDGKDFLKFRNAMTIKKNEETAEEEALRCNQNAAVILCMEYPRVEGSDVTKTLVQVVNSADAEEDQIMALALPLALLLSSQQANTNEIAVRPAPAMTQMRNEIGHGDGGFDSSSTAAADTTAIAETLTNHQSSSTRSKHKGPSLFLVKVQSWRRRLGGALVHAYARVKRASGRLRKILKRLLFS
jgi:hypothetical protein